MRAQAWPVHFRALIPTSVTFSVALGASLIVHAIVLSIHFKLPQTLSRATEQALAVILVNAKSATKPKDAQAKAQANLDGGGNTEENRIAATPLPASKAAREGDAVTEAHQRVSALEAEQRRMMTQLKSTKPVPAVSRRDPSPPTPTQTVSGLDLANNAVAMVRLEGEIARNVDEYNKRPRKEFFRPRVSEYRFAQYVEDWRQKVERVGNLNYPEAAKGRVYGSLVVTVTIRADGSIESIVLDRPSGSKVLDDAARRIIELAAPYAPFPPNIARDKDEIVITRTWSFTNSDRLQAAN